MMEGDAKGSVFSFPIPTYNITPDFDWDNPNYQHIWEMTSKYGIPYFSNFVNSDMDPEDARSMCCRLRLDLKELNKRGGGLFGANPLTGSIGVVTLNLPRIGYTSKNEKEFKEHLSELMMQARKSLEIKRKILEGLTDKNLYPYTRFYLRNIKERFGEYWKNHFSTIGLVGMNEACCNLLGCSITTKKGRDFALRTLTFMRDTLVQYQEETGDNFNLEATPAEGTSYRLAQMDRAKYKSIVCANIEDIEHGAKPFYTNSSQLPVNFTDDIFEALDMQDEIQTKYTGGTVLHLFIGEEISDPNSIKNLVRKICDKYRLPYFTISPTFSICTSHGYMAGKHFTCPTCEQPTEVYSRIVGYLRPINQWNEGKAEEFKLRKTYKLQVQ
jgi:ribonucleoside-triphosphate reductase